MVSSVRPQTEIMMDILYCYVQLSPENVWCDGEATPKEAAYTEKRYKDRLNNLFNELGREVSEQEAYNYNGGY
jgi:hypothetical protein